MKLSSLSMLLAAGLASSALAQPLMLNEIYINGKAGDSDGDSEYIEITGPADMNLDGYAIAVIADTGEAEVDEFFPFGQFDAIGSNGMLALVQDAGKYTIPMDTTVIEFGTLNGSSGKLQNDGSLTVLLLRAYDDETVIDSASWDREEDIDSGTDDSEIDAAYQPYQVIDEIAYSGDGEQEYTEFDDNELDYTPGTQPDALVRIACDKRFENNGERFDAESHRKGAYDAWAFGDINTSRYLDSAEAYAGVTLTGDSVFYDGGIACEIALVAAPGSGNPIDLTPGDLNDGASGSAAGHEGGSKYDYDCDGDVDCNDRELLQAAIAATANLDEGSSTQYVHQAQAARTILMMAQTDGSNGSLGTGGSTVDSDDLDAFDDANCALACNTGCPIMGDYNGDGWIDMADLSAAIKAGDDEAAAEIANFLR